MSMLIIRGFPPNYAALRKMFDLGRKPGVVFSYGFTIYNPGGHKLPAWIIAHEEAHGERQRERGVVSWWEDYLADQKFRLLEEIIGHRAEYRAYPGIGSYDHARNIASKLSGPLYNHMINYSDALKEITA